MLTFQTRRRPAPVDYSKLAGDRPRESSTPTSAYMHRTNGLFERLTITPGVRFDYLNASLPDQTAPAGRFVPARSAPATPCLPCWKDWSVRLGGSYDLFGNGKTALKASVGKYLASMALGRAEGVESDSQRIRRHAPGMTSIATGRRSMPTATRSTTRSRPWAPM